MRNNSILDVADKAAFHAWADSILETMSLEDQIAQMIMIWGYSNQGPAHQRSVMRQISRYNIGGILFFQGDWWKHLFSRGIRPGKNTCSVYTRRLRNAQILEIFR